MKKSDLKPGDKVVCSVDVDRYDVYGLVPYFYDKYEETTLFGVVLDKKAKQRGYVCVRWDDDRGYDDRVGEEEVDTKILTLESEIPSIEKDFKQVSEEVKDKMKEAARLIREANKLVQEKKVAKNLADMMYDAAGPLVNAMDDSGWRSSSWGC